MTTEDDSFAASRLGCHQAALELLAEWRPRDEEDENQAEGGSSNGNRTTSFSTRAPMIVDAWQLYRLGLLLAQLRRLDDRPSPLEPHEQDGRSRATRSRNVRGSSSSLLREAAHDLLAALPAPQRSDVFQNLHVGLVQLLLLVKGGRDDGGDDESQQQQHSDAVEEAVVVLSELYGLAGDTAPTAAEFRAHTATGVRLDPFASNDGDIAADHEGDRALHLMLSALYANDKKVTTPRKDGRDGLLRIVTRLVWTDRPNLDVVAIDDEDNDDHDREASAPLFSVLRTLQAHDNSWIDFVRCHDDKDENWRQTLVEHYHPDELDEDQLLYLSSLLHAPTMEVANGAARWLSPAPTAAIAAVVGRTSHGDPPRESEHDRRVRQVRQVLPDLGEGFVEAALSYYQGDVERTLAALLQEEEAESPDGGDDETGVALPEALRSLDWSLPRRARGRRRSDSGLRADDADEEALRITKSIIREADRRQEEEAYALQLVGGVEGEGDSQPGLFRNEYEDDYDDQYDDYQPGVDAKADPNDYEAIRLYNRAIKSVEREQGFWEEERNPNRRAGRGGRAERGGAYDDDVMEDAPPAYRGPDKLRGGRIPRDHRPAGRGAGGRHTSSQDATGRAPGGNAARQPDGGGGGDGRGRGRGRGGGRGSGRGGPAGGRGQSGEPAGRSDSGAPPPQGTSSRAKANRLSNRRDKRKQAAAKRVG